ncbi:MAG: DUF6326 family protein [Dermatophilaceae bacterium]
MSTMQATRTAPTLGKRRDDPVNVKVILSGLWTAMLFVFAYVDIFAYLRADVLHAAMAGKVATTGFTVNQTFLALTLIYILVAALMVPLSLVLGARVNRVVQFVVSVAYTITIIAAAAGESWAYYIVGSVVEVLLLVAIFRIAWKWPSAPVRHDDANQQA